MSFIRTLGRYIRLRLPPHHPSRVEKPRGEANSASSGVSTEKSDEFWDYWLKKVAIQRLNMGEHDWKSEVWNVFNSTADAPVKFTITRNGATLYAQVGTQSAVPLEATAEDKFKIDNGTATGHRF